ncbi:hypothetical protein Xvie_04080 [Xenorhabdus vietnamensis]|uniref:Uncharacterized protein n=1 Tax=Xenorhabdus vietnamensis TaxID=351656 RepID=A0A1Y2S7Z4_9GAMM|nr:hypothetical protein [Xenorhabdus vietnamensis]OTA14001.1 hypothetical protein Xvie_04080 [Xenorhabdus vietnamensis]
MSVEYPTSDNDRKERCDTDSESIISSETVSGNNTIYQIGKYNPEFWNKADVVSKNNCYAYACNIRVDKIPDPGYRKYNHLVKDINAFKIGIENDGLVEITGKPVKGDKDNPVWRVAVFYWTDNNTGEAGNPFGYHFFREVWSKDSSVHNSNSNNICWAHKFHTGKVTNLTIRERDCNPPHVITDPEIEMKEMKKLDNSLKNIDINFLGYYLVTPNVKIGTE